MSTANYWRPFAAAREVVRALGFETTRDFQAWSKSRARPVDIPSNPQKAYTEWVGWADWLGTAPLPISEARELAQSLGPKTRDEWIAYVAASTLPRGVPKNPQIVYKDKGWISWQDWLGRQNGFGFRPFKDAREYARSLGLKGRREWSAFAKSGARPADIPSSPAETYAGQFIGYGDWLANHTRWNRGAILAFLMSLRSIVKDLAPAELFVILRRNGLIGKSFATNSNAALLKSLETLCRTNDPEATLQQLSGQLEASMCEEAAIEKPLPAYEEELCHVNAAILSIPAHFASSKSSTFLKSVDNLVTEHLIDDEETLEFLENNRVAVLWQQALDTGADELLERLRLEHGGVHFQRIRERFVEEYEGARALPLPVDYAFKKNGGLQPPNLMQKLTAFRLLREKRMGNWSGVGSGKTLSAVLASRLTGAQLTVIIAVNATIAGWEKAIREAFPNSHVHCKDVGMFSSDPSRPNYLLLNFESFQQVWSEQFVHNLVTHNRIDFIVLDEVQSVRQRTAQSESKRRSLVTQLVAEAASRNLDLRVLGMSATPVINNLHEAKTLLDMIIGDDSDLPIKPTVENAILMHQNLIRYGIRYRPKYAQAIETSFPELDGRSILADLRRIGGRDILALEQTTLRVKLPSIVSVVKPGTLIFTQFVTGIVETIKAACELKGLSVGEFTGEEKSGLEAFCRKGVDVLIGSAPVGTGVDGLQEVCGRLVFASLPWTSAEYEQIVGRLYRQGSAFDRVEVVIPQVVLRHATGQEWSWDKLRWQRIQWKRTLADAAVDGVIPEGHLPSKEEMQAHSLATLNDWVANLERSL